MLMIIIISVIIIRNETQNRITFIINIVSKDEGFTGAILQFGCNTDSQPKGCTRSNFNEHRKIFLLQIIGSKETPIFCSFLSA